MSVENIELSKIFVSFLRTKMTTVGGDWPKDLIIRILPCVSVI